MRIIHLIGNAHIDPVWLWNWNEGMHEIHATWRTVLDLMKDSEHGDFVFTASSAAFYEWIEENDPGMFVEIQQRIADGRWCIVGGWWIEPECNLPCGESFVRQALYGQRYFKAKFGVIATVGYNPDSFGHHAMLPQILEKSGIQSYVFMRPEPHEKELPARLFWWESANGSRVLAYRLPFAYQTWGGDLEKHVRRCADELSDHVKESMCFYGVGNHGGGPTRENIASIHRLQQDPGLPRVIFSSPQDFFENVDMTNAPVVRDELQHHARGCYSAHSAVKRWNRQAENLILTAEKLSVLANSLTDLAYPTDLSRAWKQVLFNQFHDILAGTCIESAYEQVRDSYGEAMGIARRAIDRAAQSIAWNIWIDEQRGMTPIVVFNPHTWQSKACVEFEIEIDSRVEILDDEGRNILVQEIKSEAVTGWRKRFCFIADLPALGYRVYRVFPSMTSAPSDPPSTHVLENGWFRLSFDATTGFIANLYDKQNGIAVFSGAAARPVVIEDMSDTWSHDVARFDRVIGEFTTKRIMCIEDGPVRSTVRVESAYGASRLIQDFVMYHELPQIDVRVTIDWREQFKMLKLRFPVNVRQARALYEIPYGYIERVTNGEEEPIQSWMDVSGVSNDNGMTYGLALLNDGKSSCDVNGNEIGITVLRSPIYAHHMPAMPDTDQRYSFIDQGIQHFTYMLLPHPGDWRQAGVIPYAAELNQRPIVVNETYHPTAPLPQRSSFWSVDRDNILVSVIKKAEEGEAIVIRAYETHGMTTRVTIHLRQFGRVLESEFAPCEIKTWRVPLDQTKSIIEINLLEWER